MKDTEIHNGLDKKDLRDFFQIQLYEANFLEHKEKEKNLTLTGFDWSIDYNERKIEYLQFSLKQLKQKKSLIELMENLGWSEWDVSEYITRTDNFWKSFIGSDNEYNEFIKQFSNEG